MTREERFFDILGDLDEKYVALAMPRNCGHVTDGDARRETPYEYDDIQITKKEWRRYVAVRAAAICAAVLLVGAGALLLWQNWDKIAVGGPAAQTTAPAGAATNTPEEDVPMFETGTDRLRRLYPGLFGLEADPDSYTGLALAYKTDENGERVYSLYSTQELGSMSFQDIQNNTSYARDYVRSMNYISAGDMRLVLATYDPRVIKYINRFNEEQLQFEETDAATASEIMEELGLVEKTEAPVMEGTVEEWDNPVVKTIDIQEKYLSDRMPAAGAGDLFNYDMVVVCGGELYGYVNYGAMPYDRVRELITQYSLTPAEVSALWSAISPLCEDGKFRYERAGLLPSVTAYDYFTNEVLPASPIYDVSFYRATGDFLISVGTSEWGTGVRILRRFDGSGYGGKVIALRRIFELLWKLAADKPREYGDMSIVLVHDARGSQSSADFGYSVEAIVWSDPDSVTAYLTENGADMSLVSVVTTEQERASYLPVEYYGNGQDGSLVKVDMEEGWYGHDYLTVGSNVYKGAKGFSDSLDSLLEVLKRDSGDVKKTLETTPLNDLLVTPYADAFDLLMMPSGADPIYRRLYYHIGKNVIEVYPDGRVRNYVYDLKATNVRKVIVSLRRAPEWHDPSEGEYVIDRIDFVADDYENRRVYARIAADPEYHDAIKRMAQLRKYGELYYEITDTE